MRGSSLGQQFGETFSRVPLLSSQLFSHPAIVTAGRREGLKKRGGGQTKEGGREGERKEKREGGREGEGREGKREGGRGREGREGGRK